jgi:hypothetical protein
VSCIVRKDEQHQETDGLFEFVRFVLQDRLAGTKDDEGKQAGDDDAKNDKEQKRARLPSGSFRRCDWRLHEYLDARIGVAGELNFDRL